MRQLYLRARVRNNDGVRYGYVDTSEISSRECFTKLYVPETFEEINVNPVDVELFTGIYSDTGIPVYEGDIIQSCYRFGCNHNLIGEVCEPLDISKKGARKRIYLFNTDNKFGFNGFLWYYFMWKIVGQTDINDEPKGFQTFLPSSNNVFLAPKNFGTFMRRQHIKRKCIVHGS